jgi:hypothetical protein
MLAHNRSLLNREYNLTNVWKALGLMGLLDLGTVGQVIGLEVGFH